MKNERGFIGIVIIIVFVLLLIVLINETYQNLNYGDKEGTIINKYHREPYTTTSYVMSGKIMVPIINRYPESWNFELQKDVEGEKKTITIEVSQNTYNNYSIGDYFKESEEK